MFGMLDYRAHKLYWLLTLPFRIATSECHGLRWIFVSAVVRRREAQQLRGAVQTSAVLIR